MEVTRKFFAWLIIIVCALTVSAQEAVINVASYNIRQYNKQDSINGNGWQVRCPILAQLIRFHEFDVFGTQEGFKHQLEDLKAALPGYDYTGVGREDGADAGEHSAIFYRTDLFTLVDHGDFWLSETPEKPSIGWDAVLPRICSWARLRHNPTGKEFLFFNLHMDHIGKQARVESALLVQQKMNEFGSELPTFLTGDFNVDQTHQSYTALTTSGKLKDSYCTAKLVYALNGTFNDYSTNDYSTSRIDHIFVSPNVKVDKYGVLTDTYRTPVDGAEARQPGSAPEEISLIPHVARTPSDHFPVMIRARF
ncbi:endonuclease/exonuclease/phosphatase family protein [Bacteroides sp. CAG:927]|jgi:endonuclease/exonuclease/phosphatase family metal-dependent hydrolase|nr:endonuclease/exonuclease/phosphatase family protein [Bacteroides sp. CAG:927]